MKYVQDPSQQKATEAFHKSHERVRPAVLSRCGDSERAEFSVGLMGGNAQQTVQKLSGAVHGFSKNTKSPLASRSQNAKLVGPTVQMADK
jgi:hypothetical protein